MFNLSGSEIVVILLIALVVLGPEKLPDAIRRAGRVYSELRRMSSGFQQEFSSALREPLNEMRSTSEMLGSALRFDAEQDVGRTADTSGGPGDHGTGATAEAAPVVPDSGEPTSEADDQPAPPPAAERDSS